MSRLQLGKIQVDTFNRHEALHAIDDLITSGGGIVFTPNVDHIMLAEYNSAFAQAYQRASITLADGMPIVWASRLFGQPIRERVAGSDLLIPLLNLAQDRKFTVFFLGSQLHVLQAAVKKAEKIFPNIKIIGWMSPIVSDRVDDNEVETIMSDVSSMRPDIIIVALGAPKQEIFIDKASKYCPTSVMLGFGASLDFLAGEIKRAPKWMQSLGLEWFWRLCREPKRLWRRYLRDFKFPLIIARQFKVNYLT